MEAGWGTQEQPPHPTGPPSTVTGDKAQQGETSWISLGSLGLVTDVALPVTDALTSARALGPSPPQRPSACSRPVSWSPRGTPTSPQKQLLWVCPGHFQGHCRWPQGGRGYFQAILCRGTFQQCPSGIGVSPRRQLGMGSGRRPAHMAWRNCPRVSPPGSEPLPLMSQLILPAGLLWVPLDKSA